MNCHLTLLSASILWGLSSQQNERLDSHRLRASPSHDRSSYACSSTTSRGFTGPQKFSCYIYAWRSWDLYQRGRLGEHLSRRLSRILLYSRAPGCGMSNSSSRGRINRTHLFQKLLYTPQMAFSTYLANDMAHTNKAGGITTAVIVHIVCWIAQFVGHGVFEKRAPALLDNLLGGKLPTLLPHRLHLLIILPQRSSSLLSSSISRFFSGWVITRSLMTR